MEDGWDCKKCGFFVWALIGEDDEYGMQQLKAPKNKKEQKETELYNSDDGYEWFSASEFEEICESCKKKMNSRHKKFQPIAKEAEKE